MVIVHKTKILLLQSYILYINKEKGGEKMVDVKEIKSIELVPFTLMTSSIGAILV